MNYYVTDPPPEWEHKSNLDDLTAIFLCETKRELEKHCEQTTLYLHDIGFVAMACARPEAPLLHQSYFRDFLPEHLSPSDEELAQLSDLEPGPWKDGKRPKAVSKIFQYTEERRLLRGHLFLQKGSDRWHFLYFDQRDLSEHRNHWTAGSHVHLCNWLTHPQVDVVSFVRDFANSERPKPGGALHIRCESG